MKRRAAARGRLGPLRADPSRTLALRRGLAKALGAKYERLIRDLRKLIVEEDSFGLLEENGWWDGLAVNASFFADCERDERGRCTTGEGSGGTSKETVKTGIIEPKDRHGTWSDEGERLDNGPSIENVLPPKGATPEDLAKAINQSTLLHVTNPKNLESIKEKGLRSGDSDVNAFGAGTYFSLDEKDVPGTILASGGSSNAVITARVNVSKPWEAGSSQTWEADAVKAGGGKIGKDGTMSFGGKTIKGTDTSLKAMKERRDMAQEALRSKGYDSLLIRPEGAERRYVVGGHQLVLFPSRPTVNASFFATCDRDDKGRCLPGGGEGGGDKGGGEAGGGTGAPAAAPSPPPPAPPAPPAAKVGMIGRAVAKVNAALDKVPGVKAIKDAAGKAMGKLKEKLAARYGEKTAKVIMTSGPLGGYAVAGAAFLATGIPGIPIVNDLVSIGAHVAVAEVKLQLGKLFRKGPKANKQRVVLSSFPEELTANSGEEGEEVPWEELLADLRRWLQEAMERAEAEAGEKVRRALKGRPETAGEMDRAAKDWATNSPPVLNQARLTVNAPWRHLRTEDQRAEFEKWLLSRIGPQKQEEELLDEFLSRAQRQGAGRAFDDARKRQRAAAQGDPAKTGKLLGEKTATVAGVGGDAAARRRTRAIVSQGLSQVQDLSRAAVGRMTRRLTEGVSLGQSPRVIAADLVKEAKISKARAETIARTEVVRAHAEGQLDAMQALRIKRTGALVEWSTTGDRKVCPRCKALNGKVFPLAQARGMLPRHPRCRCAWVPYLED